MPRELIFFLAGVLGAGLRALATTGQETWSRKSLVDIVVGGIAGILAPVQGVWPIPPEWSVWQAAAAVAGGCYVSASLIQNLVVNRVPALNKTLVAGPPTGGPP